MPIMSFSVSDSLRSAIKKLVKGNFYKNDSSVMRDALTRLMNSYSDSESFIEAVDESLGYSQQELVNGNVMIITDRYNESTEKKLARLEIDWADVIQGKHVFYQPPHKTLILFYQGDIERFREFIVAINDIKGIQNIRYVML